MPTLADVDEALMHASLVPPARRGPGYSAFVDGLLDYRLALEEHYELMRTVQAILSR